jgi:hypothetical protein
LNAQNKVERPKDETAVYLYHGTNCWRRWEINRTGSIAAGRNGYSFFCNTAAEAMAYARAASVRDGGHSANSLISEPVVLKVKFNERTWLQVDFIKESAGGPAPSPGPQQAARLTFAVLGPINCSSIVAVEGCTHGAQAQRSVRSFADGTLCRGIKRLRSTCSPDRLDACLLKKLCGYWRDFSMRIRGTPVEVSESDQIRRLVLSNR